LALRDALVAFWELEEASGTRNDSHGTNHLTQTNGVSSATGKVGTGADFELSSSQYLTVTTNSTIRMGGLNNNNHLDFTIAFWVKFESLPASEQDLVSKFETSSSGREYRVIYNNATSRLTFQVAADGGSVASATANNFGAPTTGVWYFVVAWHDATADTINISVNDGTANSTAHSTGVKGGASPLRLGAIGRASLASYLDGMLDQVGIWKRALTSLERTELYNSGSGLAYSAMSATPTSDQVVAANGIWTWFTDPRAIYDGSNVLYFAGIDSTGVVGVYALNLTTGVVTTGTPRGSVLALDDHNNPALCLLDDGKILTAYSQHNGSSWSARSTSAGDISAWDTPVATTGNDHAYAQLIQMGDTAGTVYWFYRTFGSTAPRYFRTSTDRGSTWGTGVKFLELTSQRPYVIASKTSGSRIDLLISTGQPSEAATNSVYHGYMLVASDGSRTYFQSDGTSLGDDTALPFEPADFTLIYSGATNASWIWDIATIGGTLTVTYATFETTNTVHKYWQARWSGSAWTSNQVTTGGTTALADYLYSPEVHYSGGIALDPNDVNSVFVSREYGTGDWRLEQWTHSGTFGSGTWSKVADITGLTYSVNARPYCPRDLSPTKVMWFEGSYGTYTDYLTRIRLDPPVVPSVGGTNRRRRFFAGAAA
jgi:hypothetical protein